MVDEIIDVLDCVLEIGEAILYGAEDSDKNKQKPLLTTLVTIMVCAVIVALIVFNI